MSDPVLITSYLIPYFSCDRDPTSSEPIITSTTTGIGFLFFWYNTTNNNLFYNSQNIEDDMLWVKLGNLPNPSTHISDAANDAATDAPTNLNVVTTLLGSLTGEVNATNAKQNDLAVKYNDLATKFNLLLDHLEAQGLQLSS